MTYRRGVIFFSLCLAIFFPARGAVAALHCPTGMSLVPGGNTAVVYSGERWGGFATETEWVDDFCIDMYEASQPDATIDSSGSWQQGQPIPPAQSQADVLPWDIITWPDAKQACAAAGKRMPTLAEWQTAYSGYDGAWWPWGTNEYEERLGALCWINEPYMMILPTGGCCFENCSGNQCFNTCDMLGNVAEYVDGYWDETCYGETEILIAGAGIIGWYQPNYQVEDPEKPGCWRFVIFAQRRFGLHHHTQEANLGDDGFRCASEPIDDDTVDDDTSDDDLADDDTTDDDLVDDDADDDTSDDDSIDDDSMDDDSLDDDADDDASDDDTGGGQSDDDDRGCGC